MCTMAKFVPVSAHFIATEISTIRIYAQCRYQYNDLTCGFGLNLGVMQPAL